MAFYRQQTNGYSSIVLFFPLFRVIISVVAVYPLIKTNIALGLSYSVARVDYDIIEYFPLKNDKQIVPVITYNSSGNLKETTQSQPLLTRTLKGTKLNAMYNSTEYDNNTKHHITFHSVRRKFRWRCKNKKTCFTHVY